MIYPTYPRANSRRLIFVLSALFLVGAAPITERGTVQTVTGPMDPSRLGATLMHEHLAIDLAFPLHYSKEKVGQALSPAMTRRFLAAGYPLPSTPDQIAFWWRAPLVLEMIPLMRTAGWQSLDNSRVDEKDVALEELRRFRAAGGGAVVDVTTPDLGRNVQRLRSLSQESGVPIVAATGWYRWTHHPDALASKSVAELESAMVREIEVGIDGTDIRAGIIGEIALDMRSVRLAPARRYTAEDLAALRRVQLDRARAGLVGADKLYDAQEVKVLRAAARASRRTGVALTLHAPDPYLGHLDLIAGEGADLKRVIVGHAEPIFEDRVLMQKAFARGVTLQADYRLHTFAHRGPYNGQDKVLDGVAWALMNGHAHQVLLSLDSCLKTGLRRYGGGGLTAVYDDILPALRRRGVTEAQLVTALSANPRRLLTKQRS